MKGLIILANYFEDIEMISTLDLLRRANINVDLVSIYDEPKILSQSKVYYLAEKLLKDINLNDYSFLIIPGGKAVFNDLQNPSVNDIIMHFVKKDEVVAAICAAPLLLGNLGLLKNKEYTCFPSVEKDIDGIYQTSKTVVKTGKIITSRSAGTAIDFALTIIEELLDKETRQRIKQSIYYNTQL